MNTKQSITKLAIEKIAKENPAGFTINKKTLQPILKGYAVAILETQDSFGSEGLDKVMEFAKPSFVDAYGGWLNEKNGEYYYDAVMVLDDLRTALFLGFRNKQIAIFDLEKGKEIKLLKEDIV